MVKDTFNIPNYQYNKWHLEYDNGTWIEDDGDWLMAIDCNTISLSNSEYSVKKFEIHVVFGNAFVPSNMSNANQSNDSVPFPSSQIKQEYKSIPPPTIDDLFIKPKRKNKKNNYRKKKQEKNKGNRGGKRDSNLDMDLWTNVQVFLRRSKCPMNVLWIRRQFPGSMKQKPKVRDLNRVLYTQFRRGNLKRFQPDPNRKPLWTLCYNNNNDNDFQ